MSQKHDEMDDAPRCDCDALADLKECKNGKPENVGKEFWTCRFRKCKFFQWKGQAAGAKRKWPQDKKGYSVSRSHSDEPAPKKRERETEPSLPTDQTSVTLLENIVKAAAKGMALAEKLEGMIEMMTKATGPVDTNGSPLVPGSPTPTPEDSDVPEVRAPKSAAPAPPQKK
jgi:hypothetical protein